MAKQSLFLKILATVQALLCLISSSVADKVLATVPHVDVLLNDELFMEVLRPEEVGYTYKIRPAKNFGVSFTQRFYGIELVVGEPYHGCTRFTNAGDLADAVVFVQRGECSFVTKTVNAQDAGALAILIADNEVDNNEMFIEMVDDNTNRLVTIPAAFIMGKDGFMIKNSLDSQGLTYAVINIPVNITNMSVQEVQQPPWTLW